MKINFLYRMLFLSSLALGMSSCLKDETLTADSSDAPNVIEFADPSNAGNSGKIFPVVLRSFDVVPSDEFGITIRYSGTANAPEDIEVNVAVDPGSLQAYNEKIIQDARQAAEDAGEDPDQAEDDVQDQLFDVMPASLYSLSNNKVTIKKGEREAQLTVSVKPDQFSFDKKYGIPLKITSSSMGIISSNFSTVIFNIGAKNQYDGEYTFTSIVSGRANATSTETEHLATVNANTVSKNNIGEYFGGYTTYTFNDDGTITVGAFSAPGGGSYGAKVLESSYDETTGDFHVKFTILNGAYTFDETAERN